MKPRQTVLMGGAFALTFALLAGAFVGLQELGRDPDRPLLMTPGPTLIAVASVPPSVRPTRHPAGTPRPQTTRPPTPTRKPTADRTAKPSGAPSAAPTAAPSTVPGDPLVVVLGGDQYEVADVPDNGKLTRHPDGSITIETTRDYSFQLMVTWFLPTDAIPAGARIARLDTRICGSGGGDFWESYGPEGGETLEAEVSGPGPDGCWHYPNAPGWDSSVIAIIRLQSSMTITTVEYVVTLA